MRKTILVAIVALCGCDAVTGPPATSAKASNCAQITTPAGCPDVFRVTDPDTGAVLYITKDSGYGHAMTLLPKSEVQAEKPLDKVK